MILPIEHEISGHGLFGTVMSVDEKNRTVIAYIPKLMSAIPNTKFSKYEIQTVTRANNIKGYSPKKTLTIQNGILLKPYDYKEPLPDRGSTIKIEFPDGNIQNGFWVNDFDPNGTNELIESEKYSKLFNFKINNKNINIFSEDNVTLNIDSEKTILNENKKDKSISIKLKDSIIKSPVFPERIENGDVWFDTSNSEYYAYRKEKYSRFTTEEDIEEIYKLISPYLKRVRYVSQEEMGAIEQDLKEGDVVTTRKENNKIFFSTIDSQLGPLEGEKKGYVFDKVANTFTDYTDPENPRLIRDLFLVEIDGEHKNLSPINGVKEKILKTGNANGIITLSLDNSQHIIKQYKFRIPFNADENKTTNTKTFYIIFNEDFQQKLTLKEEWISSSSFKLKLYLGDEADGTLLYSKQYLSSVENLKFELNYDFSDDNVKSSEIKVSSDEEGIMIVPFSYAKVIYKHQYVEQTSESDLFNSFVTNNRERLEELGFILPNINT